MKITFHPIMIVLIIGASLASCKKDKVFQLSSITIVNATVDLASVKVNTTGTNIDYSTYPLAINYGAARLSGIPASTRRISAADATAPAQELFSFTKEFKAGKFYSLYLAGRMPAVDTIFKEEENYPLYPVTDSSLAVRVINLSGNSGPVNITLAASPDTKEFSNLSYKQQSEFKKYPAVKAIANTAFSFQVRNQSDSLLAGYTFTAANLTASRFKGITLVVRGLTGGTGTGALGLSFVGNY